MKLRRYKFSKAAAVGIVGVVLAHGAQADTILDFDIQPAGQANQSPLLQSFGDNAAVSSDGVTVVGAFGTPNIGLTWGQASQPHARDGTITWADPGPQLNSPILTSVLSIRSNLLPTAPLRR